MHGGEKAGNGDRLPEKSHKSNGEALVPLSRRCGRSSAAGSMEQFGETRPCYEPIHLSEGREVAALGIDQGNNSKWISTQISHGRCRSGEMMPQIAPKLLRKLCG
jgi:hypothetical protein